MKANQCWFPAQSTKIAGGLFSKSLINRIVVYDKGNNRNNSTDTTLGIKLSDQLLIVD